MDRLGTVLAIALLVATAGCLADTPNTGTTEDPASDGTTDAEPQNDERPSPGAANVTVDWRLSNAPDPGCNRLHWVIAVLASPAEGDTAEVLWAGDPINTRLPCSGNGATIAEGTLPAGTYDELVVRVTGAVPPGGTVEDQAFEDAHVTGPIEDVSLPVDLVVDANVTLTPRDNTIRITQDARADFSKQGIAIANVTVTPGNKSPGEHAIRLEAAPAVPSPSSPEAEIDLAATGGTSFDTVGAPNGSFANGRESPVMAHRDLEIDPTPSRPSDRGDEIVYGIVTGDVRRKGWLVLFPNSTEERRYELDPDVDAWRNPPGVYEVTLTVADDAGGIDRKTLRVVVDQDQWNGDIYEADLAEPDGWTTSRADEAPGRWTHWEHVDERFQLDYDTAGTEAEPPGSSNYGPQADARLTSPTIEIPEDWRSAGYSLMLAGSSQAPDRLLVEAIVDGEVREIANLTATGEGEEQTFHDRDAFADALGSDVAFRFTFTSDETDQEGQGWQLKYLSVGGVTPATYNPDLLAQAPR